MNTQEQFDAIRRRQWWYGSFCVRNRGQFVDIAFRVWRVGFRINRDHRSPKLFVRWA